MKIAHELTPQCDPNSTKSTPFILETPREDPNQERVARVVRSWATPTRTPVCGTGDTDKQGSSKAISLKDAYQRATPQDAHQQAAFCLPVPQRAMSLKGVDLHSPPKLKHKRSRSSNAVIDSQTSNRHHQRSTSCSSDPMPEFSALTDAVLPQTPPAKRPEPTRLSDVAYNNSQRQLDLNVPAPFHPTMRRSRSGLSETSIDSYSSNESLHSDSCDRAAGAKFSYNDQLADSSDGACTNSNKISVFFGKEIL